MRFRIWIACVASLAVTGSAVGQWAAIRLHNEQFEMSSVNAVVPGRQFGRFELQPSGIYPGAWAGTNQSWQHMPGPLSFGEVFGASGEFQVGVRAGLGATLWTAAGAINLQPPSALNGSWARAVMGTQQVGSVSPALFVERAALWTGSSASFVDLHPAGYQNSRLVATDGVRQGGSTLAAGLNHAGLWAGTASSHVDLHPGSGTSSMIFGMTPGEQVGYVNFAGVGDLAALWRGTAASYVNMNPPGAGLSTLNATCGVAQVGVANLAGVNGAGVWFGTPESFFSLHQFLPPGYFQSVATSVAVEGGTLYVGGYATTASGDEAFLWTGPIPAPGTLGVLLGAGLLAARRRRAHESRVTTIPPNRAWPAPTLVVATLSVCLGWGSACPGQWSAVRLHDPSFQRSRVNAVTPANQFGRLRMPVGADIPVSWSGTTQSWQPLVAPPWIGEVLGASGTHQVGTINANNGQTPWHAALWTPTGVVDLHPPSAIGGSTAQAVAGVQQAGYVSVSIGVQHAGLWQGSAASFVDLHPAGASGSYAWATDGQYQGGSTLVGGAHRAALWSGSAASHLSLHPTGAVSSSVFGMAPGEQVGAARQSGANDHAAMWRGTAGSYVDMNPPGAGLSVLNATCGVAQVGYANLGGVNGAGVWFGTPESFFSIHQFLPPGYYQSVATSVVVDNGTMYVGGYATTGVHDEAFLWTGPIPAPGTLGVLLGAGLLAARRRRAC